MAVVKGVIILYDNTRIVVKTKHGSSEEFKVMVRVHQGLVLKPVLCMAVMGNLNGEVEEEGWRRSYQGGKRQNC